MGGAAATMLLATTGLTQTAPNAPSLTQTGRVFALGNGIAGQLCFVTPDSKRVLTLGRERDAVWLDLPARRVLRHIDPPGREFERVQVHPSEPWLVWVAADGSGLRIDLDTGKREDLGKAQVDQLPSLGWLHDGRPWQGESATSPNGKFRVVLAEGRWRREPSTGRRFPAGWIANDGTVLGTEDNELLLFGMNPFQTRRIPMLFCGSPTRLAFTSDGSFLAVMSGPQVQLVDAAGNEIAVLPGRCVLTAGAAPDEFWVMESERMQRWNATTRQFVGEWVACFDIPTETGPVLVGEGKLPTKPPTPPRFERQVDLVAPHASASHFALTTTMDRKELALAAARFSERPEKREDLATPSATLSRFNADVVVTHTARFDGYARWVTFARNETHLAVGLADGSVHLLTAETLQPVAKARFAAPYVDAVALGPEQLLVSTGDRLQRLDAKTLAVLGDIALPVGLPRVDELVASPDGRRLAITCGSEVGILTIE